MSKKQDPKRKAQLNEKARTESFRFQVMWEKSQKLPEMPDETLNAELNALCEKGLFDFWLILFTEVVFVLDSDFVIKETNRLGKKSKGKPSQVVFRIIS